MIKKISFVFFLAVMLIVVAYNATILYVENNLQINQYENIYDDCHKVWSARGFYKNYAEQNSISSFSRAFSLGSKGAEVDLYFDVKSERFIISHDRPKKSAKGELLYTEKEGSILTLEKLINTVGKDHYFWLDYKNLDRLSDENTAKAIARLSKISEFDSIKSRLYIEGSNPFILSKYTDAGFNTIFGIHPSYEKNILSSVALNIYKMAYYFNNITAFAMSYGLVENPIYGSKAQKTLKGIPVFLFHVPDDEELIKSLMNKAEVRALLAGRDLSLNRADLDVCGNK